MFIARMVRLHLSLVTIFCYVSQVVSIAVESGSLRADGLSSPIGINSKAPRLSWRTTSTNRGDVQTAYQIQVASSATLSTADLWDSGKTASSDFSAPYAGSTLSSRSIGWWRVRVWDSSDAVSSWSTVTSFELGLSSTDWKASWIANPQFATGKNSLPVFAKAFKVSCAVATARLYLIGLGQHSALINGMAVTNNVLEPAYSHWNKTLRYSSYDISALLTAGDNVIGVELGKGEYDQDTALGGRYNKFINPTAELKLISQLEYTCSTGNRVIVPSDATWLTTTAGPRIESAWYGGEEYDARKILKDYSKPSGNRAGWSNASITSSPGGTLIGLEQPPLKVQQTLSAVSVTKVSSMDTF